MAHGLLTLAAVCLGAMTVGTASASIAVANATVPHGGAAHVEAWNGVCTLETNIDFVGHDVSSAPTAKPIDCCTLCQWRLGCAAYSWSEGTCYFKTGRVDTAYKAGVTSGVVGYAGRSACPVTYVDLDFVGNDIGNLPGANADDCCARCGAITGCGAVSWFEGVCYFKTGRGGTVYKAGVHSGEVRFF